VKKKWNIADPLKWAIIAGSSFVTIIVLYEFLVRRVNLFRFLFGMKALRKEEQVVVIPARIFFFERPTMPAKRAGFFARRPAPGFLSLSMRRIDSRHPPASPDQSGCTYNKGARARRIGFILRV
jgi:hypothetical protein